MAGSTTNATGPEFTALAAFAPAGFAACRPLLVGSDTSVAALRLPLAFVVTPMVLALVIASSVRLMAAVFSATLVVWTFWLGDQYRWAGTRSGMVAPL